MALSVTIALLLSTGCSDDDTPADSGPPAIDLHTNPDQSSPNADGPSQTPSDLGPLDTFTGPSAEKIGEPCAQHADCGGSPGVCLQGGEWVWPGGYCSIPCVVVDNHDPCPAGSHCEELAQEGPNIQGCIKNCNSETDCREGYSCAPVPGESFGGCLVF